MDKAKKRMILVFVSIAILASSLSATAGIIRFVGNKVVKPVARVTWRIIY